MLGEGRGCCEEEMLGVPIQNLANFETQSGEEDQKQYKNNISQISHLKTILIKEQNLLQRHHIHHIVALWFTEKKKQSKRTCQNPTKGGVAFSGFSAVFPPPRYRIVFKMP